MPATNVWGLEWLNSNSLRSYPLADSATKLDQTGTFKIPDSFIVSLYMPVNASVNVHPENFFISTITIFSTGVSLVLGYDDGNGNVTSVASTTMPFSTHTEYKSYALVGSGDFSDCVGKIVFGRLEDIQNLPSGQYLFNYEGTKLDTDCVRPVIRGITSMTLVNGNDRSEKLTGAIEFIAGTNMRITLVQNPNEPAKVRFDAVSNEGFSKNCVCTDDDEVAPCIRTINGIPPTAAGDFTIISTEGLAITPLSGGTGGSSSGNGLKIEDVNSKPCCGCNELEAVTRNLSNFNDAKLLFQNYLNRLEGSVNRMSLTVLGSRLGDAPCGTCG